MRIKAAKERLERFVRAYPSDVPGLTTWVASLPAADSAACWAAIDDLAHRMRGDDPARTLEQCRADAFVDLILTNVEVITTVTLMIPVQTATMDEPEGSLERDLIVRGGNHEPTGPKTTESAGTTTEAGSASTAAGLAGTTTGLAGTTTGLAGTTTTGSAGTTTTGSAGTTTTGSVGTTTTGSVGSTAGDSGVGGRTGAFGGGLGYLDPLAKTDDFGQPVPDPSPFIEPTWQQTYTMGFEIPGIGVIGGDVVAGILTRFETRIARVLLDERTGVVIETSIKEYLPNRAMRRFIQNATATADSPAACATPGDSSPTTSSPTPAADSPRHGISRACVNTTTGSNTTPAGA